MSRIQKLGRISHLPQNQPCQIGEILAVQTAKNVKNVNVGNECRRADRGALTKLLDLDITLGTHRQRIRLDRDTRTAWSWRAQLQPGQQGKKHRKHSHKNIFGAIAPVIYLYQKRNRNMCLLNLPVYIHVLYMVVWRCGKCQMANQYCTSSDCENASHAVAVSTGVLYS